MTMPLAISLFAWIGERAAHAVVVYPADLDQAR